MAEQWGNAPDRDPVGTEVMRDPSGYLKRIIENDPSANTGALKEALDAAESNNTLTPELAKNVFDWQVSRLIDNPNERSMAGAWMTLNRLRDRK